MLPNVWCHACLTDGSFISDLTWNDGMSLPPVDADVTVTDELTRLPARRTNQPVNNVVDSPLERH
jgi:hypothetical protein